LTSPKKTAAAEPGGSKIEAARGFAATRRNARRQQKRCKSDAKGSKPAAFCGEGDTLERFLIE